MLTKNLPRILFFDIETASALPAYKDLEADYQELWNHKASFWIKEVAGNSEDELYEDLYLKKAGIFAEFGKVVCISMGVIVLEGDQIKQLRLNSIYGQDEKKILEDFKTLLDKFFKDPATQFLCGHNIKEFDVPFLSRRMIIHGIKLPKMLDIAGKKPWETLHLLDTLELWKFGDYKNYTSLKLLAYILGIPSPKDDIDGSQVSRVYWDERDLDRIRNYCEKDVKTTARIFLRLKGLPDIDDAIVSFPDDRKPIVS